MKIAYSCDTLIRGRLITDVYEAQSQSVIRFNLSYPSILYDSHKDYDRIPKPSFLSINTDILQPHQLFNTMLASHFHHTTSTQTRASIYILILHTKGKSMANQRHLLSFFFVIISFVACYCTLQEDPLISSYVDDSPNCSIDDGGTFNNLIKQSTDVLSFKRLNTVNVIDYGAKGDANTDDTQVISIFTFSFVLSLSFYFSQKQFVLLLYFGCASKSNVMAMWDGLFQAFKEAWKVACSSEEAVSLVVPQQNYLLKPIRFSGPCKSNITVQVSYY